MSSSEAADAVTPYYRESAALSTIASASAKLGPRGLVVLAAVAERLLKGHREHGDFGNLDLNWDQEALEEDLDSLVYRTVASLRRAGRL